MSVPAQRFGGWYQEIPTGLTALGMTEKTESAPIAVSLRGVLQSAADFSITMIAGGNHTMIKEARRGNPFPNFRAINDRPYDEDRRGRRSLHCENPYLAPSQRGLAQRKL